MSVVSKKVCLLGDFAVGKTSLVRRFVHSRFEDNYISTIGVKVSRKTMPIPGNNGAGSLSMLVWDLAGSEEFNQMRATYMRGATGAILVCDFTRPGTLDTLKRYAEDLHRVAPTARLVIAANKYDLKEEWRLSLNQIEGVAGQLQTVFYPTSAKTGHEVEPLFHYLGHLLTT